MMNIVASSRKVYGNRPVNRFSEDTARHKNVASPYAAAKMTLASMLASYIHCYGLRTLTI